jgi:TolB-like protein/tetratricopeptide (TPR) repeat protein
MSEVGKPEVPSRTQPPAPTETSAAPDASKRSRLVAKLTRLRGPIAAIAAVGAILGGFVGYWNAYRTVRDSVVPAAVSSAVPSQEPASGTASVAVLPFANLSPEKADEYFSDGISEELLNVLARIPGLRVSARTASFQFKGKDTPAREIGRQLGVGYIVEGGVRKAGSQVRITAQLVKVADGFQVWSETFNRDVKDILAVQDEIAGRVAKVLQLRISEGDKLAAGATRNPAAYESYLRGREAWNGEESGARETVRLLQQAVSIDPDFALAHGKLAEVYVSLANGGFEPRDKAYPLARASAERALALDPRNVPAHNALAEYAFHYAWDWDESDRQMRQALAVDPNYYNALVHLASHEMARGRLESALDATRQAEERNPLIDTTGSQQVLIAMKRYAEAIRLARKELADHPGSKDSLDTLGIALFQAGQRDEGLRILEERASANAEPPVNLAMLGWAYGRAGQATKANAVLQRLAEMGKARRISPFLMAWVYAGLDDRERAFAELEKAYERRNPQMPFLGMFWTFDSLHDDPRFRSLLKRMKLDTYFAESPTR